MRIFALFACLALVICSSSGEAQFHDDPEVDTCLGPSDPFCADSGSNEPSCNKCAKKRNNTFHFTVYRCCSGSCLMTVLAGFSVYDSGATCAVARDGGSCAASGACSGRVAGTYDGGISLPAEQDMVLRQGLEPSRPEVPRGRLEGSHREADPVDG